MGKISIKRGWTEIENYLKTNQQVSILCPGSSRTKMMNKTTKKQLNQLPPQCFSLEDRQLKWTGTTCIIFFPYTSDKVGISVG